MDVNIHTKQPVVYGNVSQDMLSSATPQDSSQTANFNFSTTSKAERAVVCNSTKKHVSEIFQVITQLSKKNGSIQR